MNKSDILSDEACIMRVIEGDTEAFGLLVARYNNRLLNWLLPLVDDRLDAEDMVQEVMVKAYLQIKSFHGNSSFSTWLYRIAYNNAISRYRKNKAKFAEIPLDDSLINIKEEEDTTPSTQSPEALRWALKKLDPREQTLLMLYYSENKSISEISRITGQSTSNVKIRLYRLRGKLKKEMSNYDEKE
ncbi:hypothetical protein HQ47_03610 [Porphyromonas macacae]|uniref:Sigma-24 n=1 Tax=Porphyromonas macacae TaxID=28115 RepID=A0A0A2EBI8_9PORP|nr:sigma-70 family RNA polymerase sigma factor [Porphyromonas macacae]KGN75007.1 hypothetical protein HQ47_03610 [Porphyromonas macacae]